MTAIPGNILQLAEIGAKAPTADNGQAFQFEWNGSALALAFAQRHISGNVFGADSHATLLGIGGIAENIGAAVAANGQPAQWHWNQAGQPYGSLALPATDDGLVVPAGVAARHTNRFPYRKHALAADVLARVGAATEGNNRVVVLTDAPSKKRLVRQVQVSAEARFCNRDLHRWLFASLRRTPDEVARGDGLDMRTLGLPPGGEALMRFIGDWARMARLNRIGAYKLMARAEIGLISAAPALICIAGGRSRRDMIGAGRLLTRVWTDLNLAGIAVQPFYVVTDQLIRLQEGSLPEGFDGAIAAVDAQVQDLLALAPGQMLHMVLRVGYPTVDPVRSRRLPADRLFSAAPGT